MFVNPDFRGSARHRAPPSFRKGSLAIIGLLELVTIIKLMIFDNGDKTTFSKRNVRN